MGAGRAGREAGGGAGRQAARDAGGECHQRRGGPRAGAREAADRDRRADRRGAGDDEGRGDEARAGHELPRRRARAARAPGGVPGQARRAARRGAEGLVQGHEARHRARVRREARRRLRDLRPRADRGGVDRAGLQGAPGRRADGRGEGAVPRRRRGGPGGHAEPRDDPAADEVRRARARRALGRRGDPRAHRRGARLRARGVQPACDGAGVPRAPVHRRARRRDVAEPRARRGQRVRQRPRLRGVQAAAAGRARPDRRDRVPVLLRLDVPPGDVLRRPAPRQHAAARRRPDGVPGLRAVQAARARRRGARAHARQARRRGARGGARRRAQGARLPHARRDPGRGAAAAVPRPHLVVLDRRGGRADAGDRHAGGHRHERPALALLRADAPREPARRAPLRAAPRGPDARGARAAARQEQLVSHHAGVGLRGPAADRARQDGGRVLRAAPLIRLAGLGLFLVAAFLLVTTQFDLSAQGVRDHVDGYGVAGPLVYIVVSACLTVALFPGPLLAGASGLLFGTALCTPVSIAAATLGATLAFSLSRWIAHDAVEEIAPPRVQRLRAWIGQRGFLAVLYARIIPGIPYSLVNY